VRGQVEYVYHRSAVVLFSVVQKCSFTLFAKGSYQSHFIVHARPEW